MLRWDETRHWTAAIRFDLTDKRRDETVLTLLWSIRLPGVTYSTFIEAQNSWWVRTMSLRSEQYGIIIKENEGKKWRRFWSECWSLSPRMDMDIGHTMPNAMHNYELLFFRVEIQHSKWGPNRATKAKKNNISLNRFRIRIICLFVFLLFFLIFWSDVAILVILIAEKYPYAMGFICIISCVRIHILHWQRADRVALGTTTTENR